MEATLAEINQLLMTLSSSLRCVLYYLWMQDFMIDGESDEGHRHREQLIYVEGEERLKSS